MIKDYSFNRLSILTDGINGFLNDIDFYDATRTIFDKDSFFKQDLGQSNFFRQNPYLMQVMGAMQDVSNMYIKALHEFLDSINWKYNKKAQLLPMLETMKNALFGRVHNPHPYFIERGCHSLTIQSKPITQDSKEK